MSDPDIEFAEFAEMMLNAIAIQSKNPNPPATKVERAAQEILDMLATGGPGEEFTMEDLHNAQIVGHKVADIFTEADEPKE
jgi:hypothetical protein